MAADAKEVEKFKVGVVLDLDVAEVKVCVTSMNMALHDFNASRKRKLDFHFRNSKENILDAASAAIDLIKHEEVQAIIGPTTSAQTVFMMHLGDRSHVPVISFSATNPSISPSQNPYFIRTTLDDTSQVNAIAAIVEAFGWREAVPLYADTEYGNGIIPYLVDALQDINTRVPYRSVFPSSATDEQIDDELNRLIRMQTRVFIVHMTAPLGVRIFAKAKELDMMTEGYCWIITDGLGDYLSSFDSAIIDTMEGVIGIRPYVPESENLKSFRVRWEKEFRKENPDVHVKLDMFGIWAYDTVVALVSAVEKLESLNPKFDKGKVAADSSDVVRMGVSQIGPELLGEISNITLKGALSGRFNIVKGQLQYNTFQILNVIGNGPRQIGIWTPSHGITRNISLVRNNKSTTADKDNLGTIIWPGDKPFAPKGWEIPTKGKKLQIGVPLKKGFTEFLKATQNSSVVTGYSAEVFDAAIKLLNYSVRYEFVPYNTSKPGSYDDLVFGVSDQRFDAAVGDITITFDRSKRVDFTLPYNEGGVSMVVLAKQDMSKNAWIFLRPLEWKLWVTTGAFFLIIGAAIWILEHRVNREFRGGPHSAYQLGTMLSFSFSTLVFAQKERVLSTLGRIVMGIWLFVVLILTQSYTANLASMLTIRRLEPTYTDVKELIRYGYSVGYQEGTFVLDQLKEMKFDVSKLKTYNNPEEFDDLFSKGPGKGGIVAAFEELPYIELLLTKYCDKYMMVGEIYQNDGWSFVFPKGSPLGPDISRTILKLRENGTTKKIQEGAFGSTLKRTCSDINPLDSSTSLKLDSFRVLFWLTGGFVVFAVFVFFAMFLWESRQILVDSDTTVSQKFTHLLNEFYKYDERRLITYFEYQHVRKDQNKAVVHASDTNGLGEAARGYLPSEGVVDNEGPIIQAVHQDFGLVCSGDHAADGDSITDEDVDPFLHNIVGGGDQPTPGDANLHQIQLSEIRHRKP
ncbi:glutamate receptor 2.9-like isoform X2 [Papaver somniferum]|nr:glutamate receptor 2.9-like isoform X2 [Papaver somniferum]XP_026445672.1 glutamate receptor 2.9-like isoform X2 [Papaver somniferum]XP_026445673.1 glutamate receptor 2.9-like isoform X2 [Papaver somniferum]